MGHLLGLPDLYPTGVGSQGQAQTAYSGVGVFDLMGYGLWGSPAVAGWVPGAPVPPGQGTRSPAHLSAWSKIEMRWLTPTIVSDTSTRSLSPAEGALANLIKIYPNGPGDESQFFLLENRQLPAASGARFDGGLPGSGLLVWRVDNAKIDDWRASNLTTPLLRAPLKNDPTVPYPQSRIVAMSFCEPRSWTRVLSS